MSFRCLQELENIADPFHSYSYSHLQGIPLIIDNGGFHCRVGFANENKPKLIFRNLIAKLRGKKEPEILVGNDITNLEAVKWLLRSPLEANVVTQFDVQEIVFDHIFSHLGINESCIDHPVVINEPPAVPLWSRSSTFELLFECYGVPSVLTGIDALFSHFNNLPQVNTCIIVSFGHHTCHILPIVDGKCKLNDSLRINLGGFNMTLYLQRLLQLKYPKFSQEFSFTKCEQIVQNHTHFSTNYREESNLWNNEQYFEANVVKFKLGKSPAVGVSVEKFSHKSQRLLQKVITSLSKKQEKELIDLEETRKKLKTLQELIDDDEIADQHLVNRAFCQIGVKNVTELRSKLTELNQEIRILKSKLDPKQESDETVIDEMRDWLKQNNDEQKWVNHINDLKKSKVGENLWILNELLREYETETKRFKRFGGLEDVVEIGSEQIRIPELLFSPHSLIRFEQCGISEAIENVLSKVDHPHLGENIFVTGGPVLLKGVRERIESDVRSIRPFNSPLSVVVAGLSNFSYFYLQYKVVADPLLDAWNGAKKASNVFSEKFVSRQEFHECGHEYIKEYRLSNLWNGK
ncbi:Actin-related protein 5-like protein [Leptotrombidium deliense]|uniref:Actin-related protein 5-like protein n=1 Tax=Leptotrombidium deliense TaxID=299467 RepID=A0A443SG16_9ACAR|nr:Actin-related protein 5-like protein [Leptotrombidium deliense]